MGDSRLFQARAAVVTANGRVAVAYDVNNLRLREDTFDEMNADAIFRMSIHDRRFPGLPAVITKVAAQPHDIAAPYVLGGFVGVVISIVKVFVPQQSGFAVVGDIGVDGNGCRQCPGP